MNVIRSSVIFYITVLLLYSCASKKYQIEIEPSGTRIFKGMIERSTLEHDSTFTWFKTNYETYSVDSMSLQTISELSYDIHFVMVLGTWCGDSKKEVPKLFKVFDSANISEHKIQSIGVDRSKKSYDGLSDKYNIQRVPTLIVLRGELELGRIVEYPKETLEKCIVKILQNNKDK